MWKWKKLPNNKNAVTVLLSLAKLSLAFVFRLAKICSPHRFDVCWRRLSVFDTHALYNSLLRIIAKLFSDPLFHRVHPHEKNFNQRSIKSSWVVPGRNKLSRGCRIRASNIVRRVRHYLEVCSSLCTLVAKKITQTIIRHLRHVEKDWKFSCARFRVENFCHDNTISSARTVTQSRSQQLSKSIFGVVTQWLPVHSS